MSEYKSKYRPLKYSPVKVGDTFKTEYSGVCTVLEVFGNGTASDRAKVVFDDTKSERIFRISELRRGKVNDKTSKFYSSQVKTRKYSLVVIGDTFSTSNCGDCVVIDVKGLGTSSNYVKVKFINTGTITSCRVSELRNGKVKDRFIKSVFNIGYLGEGIHKANHPSYDLWYAIMNRCYNRTYDKNKECYSKVTVCKHWHNFQNFAEFYIKNYVKDYHIDKDILKPNCNLYSPDTCLFVPKSINLSEAILRKLANENTNYKKVYDMFRLQVLNDHT